MEYDELQRDRARELRGRMTPAEVILWRHLRGRRMKEFKFRRQHPLGSYIADFYCAVAGLVVELDGDSHATTKPYDQARDDWMTEQGMKVLRCYNSDVYENLDGVMEIIWKLCRERCAARTPSPPAPLPGVPGRGE